MKMARRPKEKAHFFKKIKSIIQNPLWTFWLDFIKQCTREAIVNLQRVLNLGAPQRLSMFWSFWDKSSKWNYPQVGGRGSENLVGLNFWPLFVTKNGILRFSAFGLIKWSWIKNSKWNYPQFRGCGSENFIRLNFWLLFVTKNCILYFFSTFRMIKWSWVKKKKAMWTIRLIEYPTLRPKHSN